MAEFLDDFSDYIFCCTQPVERSSYGREVLRFQNFTGRPVPQAIGADQIQLVTVQLRQRLFIGGLRG